MKHAKEEKRTKPVLLVLLLLLVALVAGGGAALAAHLGGGSGGLVYEDNAVIGSAGGDVDVAAMQEMVDRGMITMSINATPMMSLSNRAAGVNWLIENPEGQSTKLIRVEVIREDTGDKIYETGVLRPGTYVTDTQPDVELAAGQYPCTAYFYSYDIETEEFLGKAGASITLYVTE